MTESNVGVYCRIKPSENKEDGCIFFEDDYTIKTFTPKLKRDQKEIKYTFSRVFNDDSTQAEVYERVCSPLVKGLLEGRDGLLFSYGVSGSGKTYTMKGENCNPGLIPRVLKSMFSNLKFIRRSSIASDGRNGYKSVSDTTFLQRLIDNRVDVVRRSTDNECQKYLSQVGEGDHEIMDTVEDCTVFVNMVELYGDKIVDLLKEKDTNHSLDIKEENGYTYIRNCNEIEVQTPEEALSLFFHGERKRKRAQTVLNSDSSRSHLVFTIRLVTKNAGQFRINQLSLVDLAGSERANRTQATGAHLKEAAHINNSLSTLRQCMEHLRQQGSYFQYKNSKLTHLFKSAFTGAALVRMIVCVQGLQEEYRETLNVLQFAESSGEVRMLQCRAQGRQVKDSTWSLSTMQSEEDEDDALKVYSVLEQMRRDNDTILSGMEDKSDLKTMYDYLKGLTTKLEVYEIDQDICKKLTSLDEQLMDEMLAEIDEKDQRIELMVMEIDENKLRLSHEHKVNSRLIQEKDAELWELRKRLGEANRKLGDNGQQVAKQRLSNEKQNCAMKALKTQLKQSEDDKCDLREEISTLKRTLQETAAIRPSAIIGEPNKRVNVLRRQFEQASVKKVVPGAGQYGKPHFNSKYKTPNSQGAEKVLEQRERHEVPVGATHQGNGKQKKCRHSVNKPPALRQLKQATKYVLQHQSTTNGAGEGLTTALYKGPIIPSAGGGCAVTFTDAEVLTHTTPFRVDQSGKKKKRGMKRVSNESSLVSVCSPEEVVKSKKSRLQD